VGEGDRNMGEVLVVMGERETHAPWCLAMGR